ncbi:MAG: hypothetical protein AAFN38_11775 [Cyanobacteria bacterium J06560_5]
MTLAELNRRAFKTLMDNLGYVEAVRFFKQFEPGDGDYTKDRREWLDDVSLNDIVADAQKRQAK